MAVDEAQWEAWCTARKRLLGEGAPFDAHYEAFQATSVGPVSIAWKPSEARLNDAHATRLQQDLELPDYDALHAWSITHRDEFWAAVMADFGMPVVGQVRGGDALHPNWFGASQWNAVEACFDAPEDAVAIRHAGEDNASIRDVTYGELKTMADAVSNGLLAQGLRAGDAVALYMPMDLRCVALYLGIVQAGMVAVSIPDSFAAPEVAMRLRLGGAQLLATVSTFRRAGRDVPMLDKALQAAGQTRVLVCSDETVDGTLAWSELTSDATAFTPVQVPPSTTSNILFSSGTTGEPKAIPWTHLTPFKAAMDGRYHQDIHEGDVVAWPTNIGWMMGPWLVYAALMNRGTIALWQGAPNTPEFLQFIRDAKTSMLGVVPAIVRAWREAGTLPGALPDVQTFSSTGEASNPYDALFLMSLANYEAPIIEYCGGTEIGGGHMTGTVVQPQGPSLFTTPALGLDFVILAGSEEAEPGQSGEIFLVPPSIGLSERLVNKNHDSLYYEGCPEGPNGELLRRHGDEVTVVAPGWWRAQGRADDTMNLGGIKVGSIELETVLSAVEGVRECAAVAVTPGGGGAERLVIFAVAVEDTDAAELHAAMQIQIKTKLNPLFRIHDVVLVEALPRTASNKVMRRELRADYTRQT